MSKLLAITCILIALSAVSSQSCSSTSALRTLYGIGNTVTTPTASSDIKYCKSIKSSAVCCTADDMNKFQAKSTAAVANLTARVAARDLFLKSLQEGIPTLQTALRGFVTTVDSFALLMSASNYNGIDVTTAAYQNFTDTYTALELLAVMVVDGLSYSQANYTLYQKARTGCVVEMMKVQNAAYCLSCDPSATSKGYNATSGDFTLSTRVCNRLKSSCKSYIQIADTQNNLIVAATLTEALALVSKTFAAILSGDNTAAATFNQEYDASDSEDAITSILEPGYMPDGCEDGGSCDWICDGLFSGGLVDIDALGKGGAAYAEEEATDGGRRMLLQSLAKFDISTKNNRVLQSGDFDPDSDEAGVTVTFTDDPSSNTNNSGKFGSLSFGNVFVSIFVVISSVLLL